MKFLRDLLICALLVAMTAMVVGFQIEVDRVVVDLDHVTTAVATTVVAVPKILDSVRQDSDRTLNKVLTEIDLTRRDLGKTQSRALDISDQQLTGLRSDLNAQLTMINTNLNNRIDEVTSSVVGIREDVQPSIAGMNLLMQRDALPAQVLGTLGATKVAMGQIAKTSIKFEEAEPEILAGVQTVIENSNKTTEATAGVMLNLKKATTPLPWWMRLGLAIAPPLAQTALPIVTFFR